MGFRSSVSKSGLPGEGRHEGLVPRNDVLTNGARSIQPKFPEISVPKLNGSARSNRKSFEKTGPPFEVVHFSRSDRLEFWLNGSRPWFHMSFSCTEPCTDTFCTLSALPLKNPQGVANLKKAICVVRSDSIMGVTL